MRPSLNAAIAATCLIPSLLGLVGCSTFGPQSAWPGPVAGQPRELDMASIPPYRVAPPDILIIEAVNNIRPPSDRLRAGDELLIRVADALPIEADVDPDANPIEAQIQLEFERDFKVINRTYRIQPNGTVDLGPEYGAVRVAGLTLSQAKPAIEQYLQNELGLKAPQVSVEMPDLLGRQAIAGEHLVRPDGSIALGIYGSVFVAGKSLREVKSAVEQHLSQFILEPEVNVDVASYNSKVYYVISDGGGYGERVVRIPFTGNETVLDAIANVEGLSQVSSKKIWVARPAPAGTGCAQVMPVNWNDIAAEGVTETNYQVLPGDRIYVKADHFIAFDNYVAKITAPIERILGFTLLSTSTARAIKFFDVAPTGGVGNNNF
ncbi:MAG: polysaccharide biosynthesis/export family protein [Planctomycetaceae bacterium]